MYLQKRLNGLIILFFLITSFLLTGCLGSASTINDIYEILEEVVVLEEGFEEQQQPLVELEKQEKEIFNEIMSLGLKEFDQIVELSKKALAIMEKRREHIQLEGESIQASREQFEELPPLIDKLDDSDMKDKANELYEIMMERYAAHDELTKNYQEGLELDQELYHQFQHENLTQDLLEEQIEKINKTYQLVLDAHKRFNDRTNQYNEKKLEFYQAAGLEVEQE